MKGTVNRVIILGRLGQDPDMHTTKGGTSVANLNVATTERGPKDQQGNNTEQTEWHRCVLWGKTAEVAGQYLKKGSLVYLEGRLQTRKWQDQSGQDRYSTEIQCFEMQLMPSGERQNNNQPAQPNQQQQPAQGFGGQQPQQQGPQPGQGGGFDNFDDDIPFN